MRLQTSLRANWEEAVFGSPIRPKELDVVREAPVGSVIPELAGALLLRRMHMEDIATSLTRVAVSDMPPLVVIQQERELVDA